LLVHKKCSQLVSSKSGKVLHQTFEGAKILIRPVYVPA